MGTGVAGATAALRLTASRPVSCRSSTKLSQAPQSAHFPSHLGDWEPQDWQVKMVLEAFFTIPNSN
jgi:hypothetical protein